MASVRRSRQTTLSITPAAKLRSRLTECSESRLNNIPISPPTPVPPTPAIAVIIITVSNAFIFSFLFLY